MSNSEIKNQDYIFNIELMKKFLNVLKNLKSNEISSLKDEDFSLIYCSLYNQIINILCSYVCKGPYNYLNIEDNPLISKDPLCSKLISEINPYNLSNIRNNLTAHPLLIVNSSLNLPDDSLIDSWVDRLESILKNNIPQLSEENIFQYTFNNNLISQ